MTHPSSFYKLIVYKIKKYTYQCNAKVISSNILPLHLYRKLLRYCNNLYENSAKDDTITIYISHKRIKRGERIGSYV